MSVLCVLPLQRLALHHAPSRLSSAIIGTVLSLRLQNVSRHLVGERLVQAFEPTRRLIVLTEAKGCAVDLLTVGLSWLLVGVYARAQGDATAPRTVH